MSSFRSRLPRHLLDCLATLALAIFLSKAEVNGAYNFSKIVDSNTLAPGTTSSFTGFSRVSFDGQSVAFIGTSGGGNSPGIYLWNNNQLDKVVAVGDPIPAATGSFTNLANLSMDNGKIAFQGTNGSVEGVYTNLGGSLRRVADTTTQMPGSTAIFDELLGLGTPSFDVAINDSDIYFSGFGFKGGVYDEGVYKESAGALSVVANRSTIFPGEASPFTFFRGEIDADGGHVLFEPDGLYTTQGAPAGSFRKIFDRDSTLPGLTPPLSVFSPNTFSLDDGSAAFMVANSDTLDFYLYMQQSNGVFRKVVSETDINPVTGNNFRSLSSYYSLDNGRVLFTGWSLYNAESVDGIYLSNDTGFDTILSDLDTLDSKNLTSLDLFKDSLADKDFVFEATFSDGSQGLYLATSVPDPPTQTIAVSPAFDVQLRPGNAYPIGDGQQTLAIDGGSGTSFPVLDILLEFPLAAVPQGAEITAAELQLDPTNSATMTVNAFGYAGDGLASLSDEFLSKTLLGSRSGTILSTGDLKITLDPAYINALLESDTHLGLRLASATAGPYVNIAATESLSGVGPKLVLTFETNMPGDFDLDGDVDGRDFLCWQRGESPNPRSADDLATWTANFGAPASAAIQATPVPEPHALHLLLLSGVGTLFALRGRT